VTQGGALVRGILRRNARWVLSGAALLSLHQLCEAAVPLLIGLTVDRAVATGSVPAIACWLAALAGLFLILTTAYRLGARLVMKGIAYESHRLRVGLIRRQLDPRGAHTDHETGALLSISSSDVDSATEIVDHVPTVVGALVATIGCGVLLLIIDVPLGLIVLVGMPVVVLGLQWSAPLIATRVEAQQDRIGRATALAADLIRGLRPLQGIGAQNGAAARYRVANRTALAATLRASRMQSVHTGASSAAGGLAAVTVAVSATYFAMGGELTIGELITVIGVAQFLMEPFSSLALAPSWVADARGAANRIAGVLEAPPRPNPQAPQGIPIDLSAGHFTAVLTEDPRDAADLVAGFAADTGADVLVERHEPDLFSGTIATNLALSGATHYAGALNASCADEVVALHDDGQAHPITERGANLSGGQRQRLALARALAADREVLVLHDPTTAVDAVTEQLIAAGVRDLRAGRTTIVITTSPALLAVADRVLHVVGGEVVADGPHARLLAEHDAYRRAVSR
jgi:putative ABC transport system ATP-binding protein